MITSIVYTYPSPTINLGGNGDLREANIKFSVDIDDAKLRYESVNINGISKNNWTLEDLSFIFQVIETIYELHEKPLDKIIEDDRNYPE